MKMVGVCCCLLTVSYLLPLKAEREKNDLVAERKVKNAHKGHCVIKEIS